MSSQNPKPEQPNLTNFAEILHDLDGGVFLGRINRALSDVALGVVSNDRKGKVVVTFEFEKLTDIQVAINHRVVFIAPTQRGRLTEEATTATAMHVGARGRLTLFPESQPPLFDTDTAPDKRPA